MYCLLFTKKEKKTRRITGRLFLFVFFFFFFFSFFSFSFLCYFLLCFLSDATFERCIHGRAHNEEGTQVAQTTELLLEANCCKECAPQRLRGVDERCKRTADVLKGSDFYPQGEGCRSHTHQRHVWPGKVTQVLERLLRVKGHQTTRIMHAKVHHLVRSRQNRQHRQF